MSVEDVLGTVLRDRRYYERSGGGLTVSGGEPLAQPAFTLALLRSARMHGIHTCLDTSGAVHPRRIQEVMPHVDLFLYDYKASPHDTHRRLTGVSNELILENLEYLYEKGANIILRCPLVPGMNDSSVHLARIAELSERYPRLVGIEIMAYHDMGRGKSARLGLTDGLPGLPTTSDATRSHWLEMLHSMGCNRAIVG
jgi:pyruvate formate lyase activating enzyme